MKIITIDKIEGDLDYPIGCNIDEIHTYIQEVSASIVKKSLFKGVKSVAVWCKGSSGSILAGMLMFKLSPLFPNIKFRINHIKKDTESAHHSNRRFKEEQYKGKYNIVIDDFSASGATLQSMIPVFETASIKYIDLLILSNTQIVFHNAGYDENFDRIYSGVSLSHWIPNTLLIGDLDHQCDDKTKQVIKDLEKLEPTKFSL